MFYFPSSRRYLLVAITVLACILLWRSSSAIPTLPTFVFHQPPPPTVAVRVPIPQKYNFPVFNQSENHLTPSNHYFYSDNASSRQTNNSTVAYTHPILNPNLDIFWKCSRKPNKYTNHVRLPHIIRNISMVPPSVAHDDRVFWNPSVLALPYWSPNQYLIVARIATDGNYQECVICEANTCYTGDATKARPGEKPCTEEDLVRVGPAGGMRCATKPMRVDVPPTPAKYCGGKFASYVDIPGFHDPRVFYSGRGEPLMIVNTQ